MNVISATNALVHIVQTQSVTQSTYVRRPEEPYVPITDEPSVPFGFGDSYLPLQDANRTAGHHINTTV